MTPTETRVTPWTEYGHYGCARYRIWETLTPHGINQRHEWEQESGEIWLDRWISRNDRRFCECAEPTAYDDREAGIYTPDGNFYPRLIP